MSSAPVRTQHDGHVGDPHRRRLPRRHRRRRPALPHAGAGERRLQRRQRARAACRPCRRRSSSSPRSTTATPISCRRRRPRRRRVGHRRAAGGRDPALRPPRDARRRRARAAAADLSRPRRAVVDGRVGRVEPALRRDRRSHTRAPPAVAAAGRARRSACTLDLNTLAPPASRSSAGSPQSATAGRSSPAGCATSSRSPTSRWSGCSTRSTTGRARQSATAESAAPERFEPTRAPAASRLSLDLAERRDPHDRLGDRIPSRLQLAPRPGRRPQGPPAPRRRRRRAPGLYAIGLPVLRRRKSTFIHGAEDDARDLTAYIAGYLGAASRGC